MQERGISMKEQLRELAEYELCTEGLWRTTEEAEQADAAFVKFLGRFRRQKELFFRMDDLYGAAMVAAKAEGYMNGYRQGFEMAFRGLTELLKEVAI